MGFVAMVGSESGCEYEYWICKDQEKLAQCF